MERFVASNSKERKIVRERTQKPLKKTVWEDREPSEKQWKGGEFRKSERKRNGRKRRKRKKKEGEAQEKKLVEQVQRKDKDERRKRKKRRAEKVTDVPERLDHGSYPFCFWSRIGGFNAAEEELQRERETKVLERMRQQEVSAGVRRREESAWRLEPKGEAEVPKIMVGGTKVAKAMGGSG